MKKLLLFVFVAFALAACSDEDGDSRVPATAVVLDCTEKDLTVGETLQLTATPTPANTTDKVVWSSDAKEFATVSESGLVTGVAVGVAKISATYGSISATCTVHVGAAAPEFEVISFEDAEGMKALDGTPVALTEIEVVGGDAASKHSPVFWAQPFAALYGDPDGAMGLTFDARSSPPWTRMCGSDPIIATARHGVRRWILGEALCCRVSAIRRRPRLITKISLRLIRLREPIQPRRLL